MADHKKDPIKEHETIILNICDVCQRRYSYEESKKQDMACCGQHLKQIEERVGTPFGP